MNQWAIYARGRGFNLVVTETQLQKITSDGNFGAALPKLRVRRADLTTYPSCNFYEPDLLVTGEFNSRSPNGRESGFLNLGNFCCKSRNLGLWNTEYCLRNTKSH